MLVIIVINHQKLIGQNKSDRIKIKITYNNVGMKKNRF